MNGLQIDNAAVDAALVKTLHRARMFDAELGKRSWLWTTYMQVRAGKVAAADRMRDVWIARHAGSIIGVAVITPDKCLHVYVAPYARRQGVGNALITEATKVGEALCGTYGRAVARLYIKHNIAERTRATHERTQRPHRT